MYDVILKAHSCHCVSHKNRSFAGDLVQFISSSVLFSFFVDQITFQKTFDRIIFIFPFKIKLVLKVKCFYFVKIFSHIKHEVVFLFFFSSALFHCVPPSTSESWEILFCKMWRTCGIVCHTEVRAPCASEALDSAWNCVFFQKRGKIRPSSKLLGQEHSFS